MSTAHIILDALVDAAYAALEAGLLSECAFDNAPTSTVFYPEPGEPWDEDDAAAVRAVGESDVEAKIAYWRRTLDSIGGAA